jgi:hypothetical protein
MTFYQLLKAQLAADEEAAAQAINLSLTNGGTMFDSMNDYVNRTGRPAKLGGNLGLAGGLDDGGVDHAIALLRQKCGVRLPGGTDAKNFVERLAIALMQLSDRGGGGDDDDVRKLGGRDSVVSEDGATGAREEPSYMSVFLSNIDQAQAAADDEDEEESTRDDLDRLEARIMALVAKLKMPISIIADELGASTEIDVPPRRRQRLLNRALRKIEDYQAEREESLKISRVGNLGLAGGLARGT